MARGISSTELELPALKLCAECAGHWDIDFEVVSAELLERHLARIEALKDHDEPHSRLSIEAHPGPIDTCLVLHAAAMIPRPTATQGSCGYVVYNVNIPWIRLGSF